MIVMSNGRGEQRKQPFILQILTTTIVSLFTQQVPLGVGGLESSLRTAADGDAVGYSSWLNVGSRGKGGPNGNVGIFS